MKSTTLKALFVATTVMISAAQFVQAKEWTVNERQDQLMKDINESQKKSELTDKEAKKLRSRLADVARKEAKMRAKTGSNTLSEANKAVLEKELNEVSIDIKKLALEKRVEAAKAKAEAQKAAEKSAQKKAEKKQDN